MASVREGPGYGMGTSRQATKSVDPISGTHRKAVRSIALSGLSLYTPDWSGCFSNARTPLLARTA
jgi:hypothetical protein